jgi:hypothetical protein
MGPSKLGLRYTSLDPSVTTFGNCGTVDYSCFYECCQSCFTILSQIEKTKNRAAYNRDTFVEEVAHCKIINNGTRTVPARSVVLTKTLCHSFHLSGSHLC